MGQGFRRRDKRMGVREQIERSNRAHQFYGAMTGKPPMLQTVLPPKRTYTKRSSGSEHQEQSMVIEWWDKACNFYGLPHFALFAVPNGAFFGSGYATAAKLKKEGMRRGILDLMLAAPCGQFHGLFIEMKYGDNKLTDDQKDVKAYLEKTGYCVSVHWSADSAIQAIKEYLQ